MILCRSNTTAERLLRAQDAVRAMLCITLISILLLGWTAYQRTQEYKVMQEREAYITDLEASVTDLKGQVNELQGQVDALEFEAVVKPVSRGGDMQRLRVDELRELAGTVHAEAKGEPYEGKVLVARVALNRLRWNPGMSLHEILTKPYQFATGTEYTGEDMQAVQEALADTEHLHLAGFNNPDTSTDPEAKEHTVLMRVGKHVFW